jgi:hypothetical protein
MFAKVQHHSFSPDCSGILFIKSSFKNWTLKKDIAKSGKMEGKKAPIIRFKK